MPVWSPFDPFPDTDIEQWREFPELLDSDEQINVRFGATAVRSGGKLIMIDTGLQDVDGTLLKDMEQKGVDRKAVDLVVFTHLHADHVGWNFTDGKPNFPNARYLVSRRDWEHWTQASVIADKPHIARSDLAPERTATYGPDRWRLPDNRRANHGSHARDTRPDISPS